MAGFEGTRVGPVVEAAREWRFGRFMPLYAAGIAAGIGIGIAVTTMPTDAAVQKHVAVAPIGTNHVVDAAPVFGEAPPTAIGVNHPMVIELPMEFAAAFGSLTLPVAPAIAAPAEAPAPELAVAAPAFPAPVVKPASAPQAAAPAAPAAPAAAAPASKPDFYVPVVAGGGATAMETNLLALINQERANAGLAPYVLEAGLTKIARTRSQQLIDQNYFAHRDPYGYSMYVELLAYFGYSSYAWAGENLAMNNWPVDTADDEAIRGLMNSPTHRANILASDFTRIGVGEITTADGRHFYTMIFLS